MKIYLDSNLVAPSDYDGVKGLKITLRDRDSDGQQAKGFSGELKFRGEAYKLFHDKIINNPNGENEKIDIQIIDDCCGDYEFFAGEIKGRDVSWCEGHCEVSTNPIQKKETIDCVKSTIVWESNKTRKNTSPTRFTDQIFPRVAYCIELRPSFLQDLMLIIGILINIQLIILIPIVAVLSIIIEAVCWVVDIVGGDCPDDLEDGILDDFYRFRDFLNDNLVGCGRKHPSPFVRDYIKNACDICGLTFQSSILNDSGSPYYNTMYYSAPYDEGTHDINKKVLEMNLPVMTLDGFLDSLTPVYNAEWRIVDGTKLVFERKDYFETGDVWLDFTKVDQKRITQQCYNFANDDLYAFGSFGYVQDGIDWVGDEAKDYYSDIVEWNEPPNPIQKAEDKVQVNFGMSRYRDDNIDVDVLGRTIYNLAFMPYHKLLKDNKFVILSNNGTAFQPKLLIWDGADRYNAKIKRYSGLGGNNGFNYPYVFEEISGETPAQYVGGKLQMTDKKNLYHNFHQISNPRLMAFARRAYKIEYNYDCEDLLTADTNKNIVLSFNGQPRQAKVESIDVDPVKRQFTINGKI